MRLIIQLDHSQYECITMTHYYTNHFWWSNILAPGPFGQTKKKYNYEGLARKCVLFTTHRQACTSSDMCGLPAYLTVILHQAAHWSRDGLNIWIFPYCTLLLHNFILCCNRLCTQCSQVDWHVLYLKYRSGQIIWNRRWNTLSLLNIWLFGLVGGTCF